MFRRTFSALTVIGALAGTAFFPASALAKDDKDKDKDKHKQKHEARYYDRTHRDYHAWNGDEDRLYRQYLGEQHHQYRSFSKMNRQQQRAYWQWRHDHR
ncbi:MAG: hypothetical protein JWL71_663 [Acidobacteria bacterium]|nr:hypothetical protein [Acidobacteriota bacterium]